MWLVLKSLAEILGQMFKSNSKLRSKTEVLIMKQKCKMKNKLISYHFISLTIFDGNFIFTGTPTVFVFCFNSFVVSKTFLFRNGTNALNVYILPILACSSSPLSLEQNSKKRQYQNNKSNNCDVQLRTKNLNSRLWMRKI